MVPRKILAGGWVLVSACLLGSGAWAAPAPQAAAPAVAAAPSVVAPVTAPDAVSVAAPTAALHFKTAVVQSGSYYEFADLMRYLLRHLVQEGLLAPVAGLQREDFTYDAAEDYVALVSAKARGGAAPSIEFVPQGVYNLNWSRADEAAVRTELSARVDSGEVNFIIALGTQAGALVTSQHFSIPIVVIDATDPEQSGVTAVGEFSDRPNVFVQKMGTRFSSQLMMFSELFAFKRMGILIDNDLTNQMGQGIEEIRSLAQKAGFELVPCYGDLMGASADKSEHDFARCLTELSSADIDALFLTLGYRPQTPLIAYLKPFIDRGIPVYSQYGAEDVRRGALISLAEPKMQTSGMFMADVIKQIAQGVRPDRISQYFNAPLHMSFNLEVARLIQWQPSFEVLLALDQVFTTISE